MEASKFPTDVHKSNLHDQSHVLVKKEYSFNLYFNFICMGALCAYVCAPCECSVGRGVCHLELELEMAVSCHVGAGN